MMNKKTVAILKELDEWIDDAKESCGNCKSEGMQNYYSGYLLACRHAKEMVKDKSS